MQLTRLAAIWILTVAFFPGCGMQNTESSRTSSLHTKTVAANQIVIALGGFSSCATPLHTPYQSALYEPSVALVRRLQSQAEVRSIDYFLACFGQSNSKIRFVKQLEDGKSSSGDVDDIFRHLTERLAHHGTNHQIHLVGHSYGGSLAMELLVRLPSAANVKILATLDAISRRNCTVGDFVNAYTRSAFNLDPHPGCTEPPSDFQAAYPGLNRKTERWINAYQSQYAFLHSGFIGQADENLEREFDVNPLLAHEAHSLINSDEAVWQQILTAAASR